MPLSVTEINKLSQIFKKDILTFIYEIITQNNMINCHIMKSRVRHYSIASESWIEQIKKQITQKLGHDFFNTDYTVYIISSNTHSVTNCLSHWVHKFAPDLLEIEQSLDIKANDNALYIGLKKLLDEKPAYALEKIKYEQKHGIYHLEQNFLTGIDINLIQISKLSAYTDKYLDKTSRQSKGIIFNIDYTYGKQSEAIIRNLILLFGKKIKSVSVFGKAGSAIRLRGDIIIPNHFIMQSNDVNFALENHDLTVQDLKIGHAKITIHKGHMLTVLGTLIQNNDMLIFYRDFWQVAGMEMEGGYLIQEINRAKLHNLISSDIKLHFAYYVSDTPLLENQTLATGLTSEEGIPPVYTITRAILRKIIARDNDYETD